MVISWIVAMQQLGRELVRKAQVWIKTNTTPASSSQVLGTVADLFRSKNELVAENALLRQQVIVLKRSVKQPKLTRRDRWLMVLLSSKLPHWKQALLLVQPATLLRWHRELFKWVWRRKSKHTGGKPPLSEEVIALIQRMITENRLWGVKRVRGELLKLGWRVSKSTVQKYWREKHPPRRSGPTWSTFLHTHAEMMWACDFVQVTDIFFRSLFAFVIVELGTRRVVQVGVTRHPTDAWVAQQLREATPFGQGPNYLIRDNDNKYGTHFAKVAAGTNIKVLTTPYHAPRANAICERFIGSVRRECLDWMLIWNERHLRRVLHQ
jgi:putative transposase